MKLIDCINVFTTVRRRSLLMSLYSESLIAYWWILVPDFKGLFFDDVGLQHCLLESLVGSTHSHCSYSGIGSVYATQ